jgi:acetylglutamate kinase
MPRRRTRAPIVLKLGGELLDTPQKLASISAALARIAKKAPLVVVHGGGKEIDAALAHAGIVKHQVDGLRVTDAATLDVVVSVLAGTINTSLVAAVNVAGARAVGLTGVDARVALVRKAPPHKSTTGDLVDLGLVGVPSGADRPGLLDTLVAGGFVPVVACVSADRSGRVFNVNADTLAGSLAARLAARRLVIAGGTAGVLDREGQTITALDGRAVRALVGSGTANAGMVAKLAACQAAAKAGVTGVWIVDGKLRAELVALATGARTHTASGTKVTK